MQHYITISFSFQGGDPLPGGKSKPRTSAYPNGVGSQAPAWVAFDRQVSIVVFLVGAWSNRTKTDDMQFLFITTSRV